MSDRDKAIPHLHNAVVIKMGQSVFEVRLGGVLLDVCISQLS